MTLLKMMEMSSIQMTELFFSFFYYLKKIVPLFILILLF